MTFAFRHLLLAAMLLHAMIPLGWMPGQAQLGEAAFVICTADGQITHGKPGQPDQAHQLCAFAGAAQAADLAGAPRIALPSVQSVSQTATLSSARIIAARFTPYPPRAPPRFA